MDAGRRSIAAVGHVVHVRRAEGHRLAGAQAPPAEPAARSAPGTAPPGCPRRPRMSRTTRHGRASRCPGHAPRPAARHRTRSNDATVDTSARRGHAQPGRPTARDARPARQLSPATGPGTGGRPRHHAMKRVHDRLLALRAYPPAWPQSGAGLARLLGACTVGVIDRGQRRATSFAGLPCYARRGRRGRTRWPPGGQVSELASPHTGGARCPRQRADRRRSGR